MDFEKKIKKLAEECLAHHGADAFCEDWDCRTVLQVFAELEKSEAEVKRLKSLLSYNNLHF